MSYLYRSRRRSPLFVSLILALACAANSLAATPNQPLYEIPFEYEIDKIIVPVSVNGSRPLRLVLDTGMVGGIFLMKPTAADGLGLEYVNTNLPLRGAGPGTERASLAMGASVKLGALSLSNERVIVLNKEGTLGRTGWDGAIGHSIFKRFVVEIDVEAKIVKLFDPAKFKPSASASAVDLVVTRTKPYIKTTVSVAGEKPRELKTVVDTGAGSALLLSKEFVAPNPSITTNVGSGVGGEVRGTVARASLLKIGQHDMKNIIAMFNRNSMPVNTNALIGMGLLNRFKTTFDYKGGKMYLQPNGRYKEPFEFNMFGLNVRPGPGGLLRIIDVFPNSPASEAGVKAGDTISTVQGKATDYLQFGMLLRDMRVPGKTLEFEVVRDEKKLNFKLVSRRLL